MFDSAEKLLRQLIYILSELAQLGNRTYQFLTHMREWRLFKT
jgi:hypothetical protein